MLFFDSVGFSKVFSLSLDFGEGESESALLLDGGSDIWVLEVLKAFVLGTDWSFDVVVSVSLVCSFRTLSIVCC